MLDMLQKEGELSLAKGRHLLKLSNIIIDYSIYYGLIAGDGIMHL